MLQSRYSPGFYVQPSKKGLYFVAEMVTIFNKRQKGTILLRWAEIAFILPFASIPSIIFHFRTSLAKTWVFNKWAPENIGIIAAIVLIASLLTGIGLALWKKKQLFSYGLCEIIFGAIAAYQIALTLWPEGTLSNFIAIGSAVYVITRGSGNIGDALSKESESRIRFETTELEKGSRPDAKSALPS